MTKFLKLLGNMNSKIEEIISPNIVVKKSVAASLLIPSKYFDTFDRLQKINLQKLLIKMQDE